MEKYKYYCDKCKYGTNIKNSILLHNNTNFHITGEKKITNYKCELCDFETVNKNNFLTHKLNNHSNTDERKEKFKFYCEKCNFGVFTESMFIKHCNTKYHQRLHNLKKNEI